MRLFCLALGFFLAGGAWGAEPPTRLLQQGLFEEEANLDLHAAIRYYQQVVQIVEPQRKFEATALYRLGECYRKLGETNQAVVEYERVLRDFSDQTTLARVSRQQLSLLGVTIPSPTTNQVGQSSRPVMNAEQVKLLRQEIALAQKQVDLVKRRMSIGKASAADLRPAERDLLSLERQLPENAAPARQRTLLEQEKHLLDEDLADMQKRIENGRASPDDLIPLQRQRLELERQIAGLQNGSNASAATQASPVVDQETAEIERLQDLVQNSPDLINAVGQNGETLLDAAAAKGQLRVAQFLLDHGADVNGTGGRGDSSGLTPLHYAAGNGQNTMVKFLLQHGARVGVQAENGVTPLLMAAAKGYRIVVETLIAAGAPLGVTTAQGPITTWRAKLPDLQYQLGAGNGPLVAAARGGFTALAELLLKSSKPGNQIPALQKQQALMVARSFELRVGDQTIRSEPDVPVAFEPPKVVVKPDPGRPERKLHPQKQQVFGIPGSERTYPGAGRIPRFWLSQAVRSCTLLRISSDTSHIQVKRDNARAGEHWVKQFDLSKLKGANDLWLRNGDIITIPDKAN